MRYPLGPKRGRIHLFMTYPSIELENADRQPVSPGDWLRGNHQAEPVVQLARRVFDSH